MDIRQYGSGNAGTTNALRTLGKKAGSGDPDLGDMPEMRAGDPGGGSAVFGRSQPGAMSGPAWSCTPAAGLCPGT